MKKKLKAKKLNYVTRIRKIKDENQRTQAVSRSIIYRDRFKDNISFSNKEPSSFNSSNSDIVPKGHVRKQRQSKTYFNKQNQIKALNFIGYFGIIAGCLCQCFYFLAIYFEYPTTVELNVAHEAILNFPAVTVCNSNPVRYKIWCKEDKNLCVKKPGETLEDFRARQGESYDRLEKKRRIDLGYTLKDFIVYAEYKEEYCTDRFDKYYDYEFTNCYTFNAAWGNSDMPLRTAFVFNPVTGKSSELVLCVNTDIENYSNITGFFMGRALMTIHANDIIPNPTYDAATLEAGNFYSYGIQKVTTRLLKSPYQTRCRNYEEEKEYRTGARMSQKNCLLECFKNETEKLCGCTYRRLSLMYDAKPCENESQFRCLEDEEDGVLSICNPQCPMACQKVEFQYVATDVEPLRKESSLYERMYTNKIFSTPKEMRENLVCVRIHYGSTETRTLSHQPKYQFIELFSLLGGYSGLWLGFSLLNGHEFILAKMIHYFMKRNKVYPKHRNTRAKKRIKF